MIRWASLLSCVALMGCSFSPDQCFEDSDCPDGNTCVLKGDVLLCAPPFVPATNNGSPDLGTPPPDMSGPDSGNQRPCDSSCRRDGFEPNDEAMSATLLEPDRYGCSRGVLTQERPAFLASLCADDVDWYEVSLMPCESRSFLLNVDIVPTTACGPERWDVRGDVWSCDSPTVSCITNEHGRRIRFLISSSLGEDFPLRFAVRSFGAKFDYEVRISAEN